MVFGPKVDPASVFIKLLSLFFFNDVCRHPYVTVMSSFFVDFCYLVLISKQYPKSGAASTEPLSGRGPQVSYVPGKLKFRPIICY
jgi:hypothetical protein